MTENLFIQQLKELHYPGHIDVANAVMAEVRKKPLLVAPPAKSKWGVRRITAVVAACAVIAVAFNFTLTFLHQTTNPAQLADDIAAIYNYHASYGDNSTYYEAYLVDVLLN